ncbi:hypothetical protein EV421DRAFT_1730317 [Armillaria borealis]|uniref:Uncharacterized protein n=1 Tax=Armillaria borealis TaxID=47425 RepID=A0AA39J488_9AGAR|nr:hypothetical protein EV421DRAFT_1745808 [Armillaria borealis]KAK0435027.1 hypothetical protein EV421DRAFT_1740474 [Armillaria borealis]KAK0453205.1 hypothetical protein EV421DRAFT_1730317 [Armillaria borealis]
MTKDLNVLRAGKPHIYDVKTIYFDPVFGYWLHSGSCEPRPWPTSAGLLQQGRKSSVIKRTKRDRPPKLNAPTSPARYHCLSNHRKFLTYATRLRHRAESEEEVVVLKGTQVKRVNRHGMCADILSPSRVFKARRMHLSKSLPDDSSGKRLAMKRLRRGPGQPDNRPFV